MLARANERLLALKHEDAPRSWSNDAKLAFLHLKPEIQMYYVAREKDRQVRHAQNDRAEALRNLALAEAECARLKARIAELEKPDVRETGNDPIAAEPKGNNDGSTEINQTLA